MKGRALASPSPLSTLPRQSTQFAYATRPDRGMILLRASPPTAAEFWIPPFLDAGRCRAGNARFLHRMDTRLAVKSAAGVPRGEGSSPSRKTGTRGPPVVFDEGAGSHCLAGGRGNSTRPQSRPEHSFGPRSRGPLDRVGGNLPRDVGREAGTRTRRGLIRPSLAQGLRSPGCPFLTA